jgi:acyl transferase domain-containing protein
MALVNLLQRFGVGPSAVVGHSAGEIAAAYVSLSLLARSFSLLIFSDSQICGWLSR